VSTHLLITTEHQQADNVANLHVANQRFHQKGSSIATI